MAESTELLLADGFPIWDWISRHHPLNEHAISSLLREEWKDSLSANVTVSKPLDEFISFLRKKFVGGCLCINPSCLGCVHSGQDVLLFVHKLSEYFRSHPMSKMAPDELVFKLVSFSKECRSILATTVTRIAETYSEIWRFLSFDERKTYYRVFSRICKPLLISLARLFFTLFRRFLHAEPACHDSLAFKSCIEELSMIRKSFSALSTSTLYEFSLIQGQAGVELGIPENSSVNFSIMHRLCDADRIAGRSSAFERVRMPDEVIESAHLVFDEIGSTFDNPESLASMTDNPQHISILRGMGFRQELFSFLSSICTENCDDKAFESTTLVASAPLAFRDETSMLNLEDGMNMSLLNLDDARLMRSDLPIFHSLKRQAMESDVMLHQALLNACIRKLRSCIQDTTPAEPAHHHDVLLDFAKALRSVVSLASDSSSSKFMELCFGEPGHHKHSVFTCIISLAQLCIIKSGYDTSSGTNYAATAFIFMSVAVSIVCKQKQGRGNQPQISKDHDETFPALNDLSNIHEFSKAITSIDRSVCCRFVSSWFLAGDGQFFSLFREHQELFSSLVPLDGCKLFRECVVFVRTEAFQHYVPSVCYLWLCNQPTFADEFSAIFACPQQAALSTASISIDLIPHCISPFPSPLHESAGSEGNIVSALFNADELCHIDQKSAALILANIVISDSDASAQSVSLIGSILRRIKKGDNSIACRVAIETLLPVMEHPGLHGVMNRRGGIDGGWYREGGFFMRLLYGKTLQSIEQTNSLENLSVRELLAPLEANSTQLDSKGRASHINSIFTNLILLTRGINTSQKMWRLETPSPQSMLDRFLGTIQDGMPDFIKRVFAVLHKVYSSPEDRAHFIFSLSEMVSVASALLCSRNFAWRRPLNAEETDLYISGIRPLLVFFQGDELAENAANAIFSVISPEIYIACMDNARTCHPTLLAPMKEHIGSAFVSTLSTMKELTLVNAAVALRVICLYFECMCSMFKFNKTAGQSFWCDIFLYQKKTKPARVSIFESDVWPKNNAQRFNFQLVDVQSVCEVIAQQERFQQFWSAVIALQDVFNHSDSLSQRLELFKHVHQAVAHAATFHADSMLTSTISSSFHSSSKDHLDPKNQQVRSAASAAVGSSYRQLQHCCSVLIPSESSGNVPEKLWLVALPVLREILLLQTSFVSSASWMFLGHPILLDGHVVAASHSPWLSGKVEPRASMLSCTSYDNHAVFANDSEPSFDLSEAKSPKPHFSSEHIFAAVLLIVTATVFDFLGSRSSFFLWLHQVASSDLSQFAPTHASMTIGNSDIHIGSRVRIHGLKGNLALNGRAGFVSLFKNDRWTVQIASDGTRLGDVGQFKPDNLTLLDNFSPDVSSRLQADLAADVLGLLPFREPQNAIWSDVLSLSQLEFELWRMIDQQWSKQCSNGVSSLCKSITVSGKIVFLSAIQDQLEIQGHSGPGLFSLYGRPLQLSLSSLHPFPLPDDNQFRSNFECIQAKIRAWVDAWPSDQLVPPHARCHMLGSFFRIAAVGIASRYPSAQVDANILTRLCKQFCQWFATARLHTFEMLNRPNDTNALANVVTAGLETIRSALHCLMLLPFPQYHLRSALDSLLAVMTDSCQYSRDLSDVVISMITKQTTFTASTLKNGSVVCVHDLASENAVIMNGKIGSIFGDFNPDTERWPVDVKVSDVDQRRTALRSSNIFPQRMRAEDCQQLLSSILLNADGTPAAAFQAVLDRPVLFMKVCNWLMANHQLISCSQLLIQLVTNQNFPKVVDILQPRASMNGISNQGNTCFIASLYQQLASIPKFVSALQCATFGPEGKRLSGSKSSKINFLKDFFMKISNGHYCMSDDEVKDFFQKLGFSLPVRQDDPMGVLRSMISWIVAETSDYDHFKHGDENQMKQTALDSPFLASTLVSKISKQVSWQDGSTHHFTRHSEIESMFDTIDTLHVDSDAHSSHSMASIEEVLRTRFVDRATVSEDGNNTKCTVTLEFETLPEVLVLGLNACGHYDRGLDKDPRVPSISQELDMSKCAKLASSAAAKNTTYELNGIILHHGDSVFGGHYTSLVHCADSSWVHINDEECHAVSSSDMSIILNRAGSALPKVNGRSIHLTGKPYCIFYSLKCISHPCSPVLFDTRLVESMAVCAQSSVRQLIPSPFPALASSGTLSLCFKLATLYSNDIDRLLSIAYVCSDLFTPTAPQSQDDLLLRFDELTSSEGPELLIALCKLRDRSSDHPGCHRILNANMVLKLAESAASSSTRATYRRIMAAFEVARPFTADHHQKLCHRICRLISELLPSARAAAASQELVSTKAYAVLKCISDLLPSSPFLLYFSQDPLFVRAVISISQSLSNEVAQGESNMRDDDQDEEFVLVRTTTASSAMEKLRALTAEPLSPSSLLYAPSSGAVTVVHDTA